MCRLFEFCSCLVDPLEMEDHVGIHAPVVLLCRVLDLLPQTIWQAENYFLCSNARAHQDDLQMNDSY
ncbi:hypothetical protein ABIA26_002943 [Sinorhizobium fredii]